RTCILLQPRQLERAMVLPFLNMVPDKLLFQPGGLPSGHLYILPCGVMMDGKPLATLATDNGLHHDVIGTLRSGADAPDQPIQVHQRGSRRGRPLPSRRRPLLRKPPLRSAWGLASFTVSVRPPDSFPFSAAIAFSASSSLDMATKPNPRDLPVSRSVTNVALSTLP